MKKKPKLKMFEVEMDAAKTFYVEAESKEAALKKVQSEEVPHGCCEFDYEHTDTRARELETDQARFVRESCKDAILKP